MDNKSHVCNGDDVKPDLLVHKYRPESSNNFTCHTTQAIRLKKWVQDFVGFSKLSDVNRSSSHDDTSSESESSHINFVNKCALLTGPPGVGKTSLVYTVAKELKLHVVESHPSEKRDSKLFSMLKLTNQKGKINPIAKLFQAAQDHPNSRKKRIRLTNPQPSTNQPQRLSLSSDFSIILFDDVDVFFEDDGPFLKSLVEFIRETKRPVILTATKSIEHIKNTLLYFEHIHLAKPIVDDCASLLSNICKMEKYKKLSKLSRCKTIAEFSSCDIRQCINRIHFYGEHADLFDPSTHVDCEPIEPDIGRLKLSGESIDSENSDILNTYDIASLLDLMDCKFNFIDRDKLLERWLEGIPSHRNEEHTFNHDLGEKIRESVVELTKKLLNGQLMIDEDRSITRSSKQVKVERFNHMSKIVNDKIKSRVEPPETEFFVDLVPHFAEIVKIEYQSRLSNQMNGSMNRRSRRSPSYLDTISVYLDMDQYIAITETMIDSDRDLDK